MTKPASALIPIIVLDAGRVLPRGWSPAAASEPGWWRGADEPTIEAPPRVTSPAPPARRPSATHKPDLFAAVAGGTAPGTWRPLPEAPPWIARLIGSDTFTAQRRLAGRAAPPDEQIERLMATLARRG